MLCHNLKTLSVYRRTSILYHGYGECEDPEVWVSVGVLEQFYYEHEEDSTVEVGWGNLKPFGLCCPITKSLGVTLGQVAGLGICLGSLFFLVLPAYCLDSQTTWLGLSVHICQPFLGGIDRCFQSPQLLTTVLLLINSWSRTEVLLLVRLWVLHVLGTLCLCLLPAPWGLLWPWGHFV